MHPEWQKVQIYAVDIKSEVLSAHIKLYPWLLHL